MAFDPQEDRLSRHGGPTGHAALRAATLARICRAAATPDMPLTVRVVAVSAHSQGADVMLAG